MYNNYLYLNHNILKQHMENFSIGIPTINRADLLIHSVERYVTDFPNVDIHIIDNGKQGLKSIFEKYPNVFVYEQEFNLGVAESWNELCKIIYNTKDYALILNDDIYLGYSSSVIKECISEYGLCLVKSTTSFEAFLLNKHYYNTIGEFDSSFYPAYYEDSDYIYRMMLYGSGFFIDDKLNPKEQIVGGTYEKNHDLVNNAVAKNREIYIQKWGGMPLLERFNKPYNMNLTCKNVQDTFMFCLFYKEEDFSNNAPAKGIRLNAAFHPERLKKAEQIISDMLNELPDSFRTNGDSFLNMCQHIEGFQWCDLHQIMEQLLLLGLAIGKITYLQERDCWDNFEGGMPCIFVKK